MKNRQEFGNFKISAALMLLGLLLLSGCDEVIPTRGVPPSDATTKEGVMIVYPEESAQFYVGDLVDIHATIGDTSGFSAAMLTVNDQVYRRDQFLDSVNNGDLYQPWIPTEAGVFALQIHGESLNGSQASSNIVNVYVGMDVDDAEPPIPEEPAEEAVEEAAPEEINDECPVPMITSRGYPFCRSGPGTAYTKVTNLQPGQSFPVVAISGSRTWWEIEYSTSGATCWVWDDLVDVCGDTDEVPVVTGTERDAETPVEEPVEEPDDEEKPDHPTKEPHPTKDPGSGPTTP